MKDHSSVAPLLTLNDRQQRVSVCRHWESWLHCVRRHARRLAYYMQRTGSSTLAAKCAERRYRPTFLRARGESMVVDVGSRVALIERQAVARPEHAWSLDAEWMVRLTETDVAFYSFKTHRHETVSLGGSTVGRLRDSCVLVDAHGRVAIKAVCDNVSAVHPKVSFVPYHNEWFLSAQGDIWLTEASTDDGRMQVRDLESGAWKRYKLMDGEVECTSRNDRCRTLTYSSKRGKHPYVTDGKRVWRDLPSAWRDDEDCHMSESYHFAVHSNVLCYVDCRDTTMRTNTVYVHMATESLAGVGPASYHVWFSHMDSIFVCVDLRTGLEVRRVFIAIGTAVEQQVVAE